MKLLPSLLRTTILAVAGVALLLWAPAAQALTLGEVFDLLDAGVDDQIILQQMEAERSVFYLDADDIIDLQYAGASDELILAMIATHPDERRDRTHHSYGYDRDPYRSQTYVSIYYDPFGYYWYPSPGYFRYCAPFGWFDFGFYYGGHVWWGWAGWGPRYHYYAYDCGYYHWYPERRGDRLWSRGASRSRTEYVVSRKSPRSASRLYTGVVRPGESLRSAWERSRNKPVRARSVTSRSSRRSRTPGVD
ncbi:MAG: hypothetical protein GF355_07165, partial [Candidatus Eisenbacteria bacterium]|nr:hypothetical protein [Candidatus Eisenbacteria bacterium]